MIDLNKLLQKDIVIKVTYQELGELAQILDNINVKCPRSSNWKTYRKQSWYSSTMEKDGKSNKSFGNGIIPFMILDIFTALNVGTKTCFHQSQINELMEYYPKKYNKKVISFNDFKQEG